MLLWIFVSKCDSCSCVKVCRRGVRVCVRKVVRVYLQRCVCVCLHMGAWVCAVTSAAKLYCYCTNGKFFELCTPNPKDFPL